MFEKKIERHGRLIERCTIEGGDVGTIEGKEETSEIFERV
jgi:hypothetical protein